MPPKSGQRSKAQDEYAMLNDKLYFTYKLRHLSFM
jgi:hypothetical protein